MLATSCFVEFMTNGELRSPSSTLPRVPPMSTSLTSAGNIPITTPGSASMFAQHEDLVGKICELAGVSKGELLVAMEELMGSLIILNIVMQVKSHHELSDDVLPIMVELTLPMWVCPENCTCIFHPGVEPVRVRGDLGFGFPHPLCRKFEAVAKVNNFIISGDSRETVFNQHCEINLSVCQDISPEGWGEIWVILLGLKTLECSLDIDDVGVLQ